MAITRTLPRPLGDGSRVGVVALSGPVHEPSLEAGLAVLRDAGFVLVEAPNLRAREGYLAGDDGARLGGLEAVLDAGVEALWAARGGYGTMRLLERMPWDRLAAWGGWVVGFSDLTALHAGLATRASFATVHGPMVQSLPRGPVSARATMALLRGEQPAPRMLFGLREVVRPGLAKGVAVGGNLAMLAALAGTPFEPDYAGAVLFVEDVGEPLYRLDRLLTQLSLSSRLESVQAVVAGRLARCGRGEVGWRSRWRAMLAGAAPPGAVVLEGLPFGHGRLNMPIPLGVEVVVDSERGTVTWGGR
ncbi:MAG TPA: LD-carboxypeptidase [Thermoanaerobaculaceae bacterium]|nr:LD-carboxypeptidase [Thermoanaerobaculaceae bacterium]HRS16804.1 LD-carboxypeptidase [Thermoanaerobaculaceae bacterium]